MPSSTALYTPVIRCMLRRKRNLPLEGSIRSLLFFPRRLTSPRSWALPGRDAADLIWHWAWMIQQIYNHNPPLHFANSIVSLTSSILHHLPKKPDVVAKKKRFQIPTRRSFIAPSERWCGNDSHCCRNKQCIMVTANLRVVQGQVSARVLCSVQPPGMFAVAQHPWQLAKYYQIQMEKRSRIGSQWDGTQCGSDWGKLAAPKMHARQRPVHGSNALLIMFLLHVVVSLNYFFFESSRLSLSSVCERYYHKI